MEQPFKKPPFWAVTGPQFMRYNELDTFLRMSSFAWHTESAKRVSPRTSTRRLICGLMPSR